ncbi:Aste57867_16637 [Aphanomyces stellatus]|uniref:Purple acid phosphatase n=1 Tax=Aphanomyces stellatus TaxID=120398 RepID=A0A485L6V9_9STRA|nr:hypothetical protein As57867_016580 [Aphanomyces stellatus]VFT93408.1 Aste57867_16637 [Aphanomyces stellatus]
MVLPRLAFLVGAALAAAPVSQVRLALTTDVNDCSNGMAVQFASTDSSPYDVTFYAEGDQDNTQTVQSTSENYSFKSGNCSYTSPELHKAFLCDLAPSTRYTYTVGNKTHSFLTPMTPGCDDAPTVIGVVGDPGDTTHSGKTIKNLVKPVNGMDVQAIFIAGDYSYANGQAEYWDKWYNFHEATLAGIGQLGINGNHEVVSSKGHTWGDLTYAQCKGEDYRDYFKRVITPITDDAKAAKQTYYSYDIGLVHLIFLDDYAGSAGSEVNTVGTPAWKAAREAQLQFLKDDFIGLDRDATPWVIVIKHNPFYNTWKDHQCQCSKKVFEILDEDRELCWNGNYTSGTPMSEPACGLQAKFEQVYVENGVNVVMAGHVHGYERTAPIVNNKIDHANGVVYITTGAGGNFEGPASNSTLAKLPEWSLKRNNQVYGSSKVIATRESLELLWFSEDDGDKPWDSVTLTPRDN